MERLSQLPLQLLCLLLKDDKHGKPAEHQLSVGKLVYWHKHMYIGI